jgi:hypothetical protein
VREDPVISGGAFKVALVLLVAGMIGVGAYAITGGIDINLPDLPDVDTLGESTNLENTDISDTTINGDELEDGETTDPFTSAGFSSALNKVGDEVGPGQELTRLFINGTQTQMIVVRGDQVEAYSVRADTGEVVREDATITISGSASISDFAFSLDGIKADSVDRMLASAQKQSGADDFEPTVLSLERGIPFGRRALEWTINAQGGGRNLLYRANPDGTKVRNEGGEGSPIPPAAIEAQKLNKCIEDAGDDTEKIFACLEQFQ